MLALAWTVLRPRFLTYLFGPAMIVFATQAQSLADFANPVVWAMLLYTLLPANLLLYGINDLADQDTDRFSTKKHGREHIVAARTATAVRNLVVLSLLLTCLLALFLGPEARVILAIFVLLSGSYSLAPFRFKARPLVDAYSNVLYIMPAASVYAQLTGHHFPLYGFLLGLCWCAAMHAFSAIPDIDADTKAGLRTTAVALGRDGTLWFCVLHWSLAALIATVLFGAVGLFLWIYPLIALALLGQSTATISRVYWKLPVVTTSLGIALVFWIVIPRLWL